jgi:hypothetical protein
MLVVLVLLERGSSRSETSAWPQVKRTLRNPIVLASVVGIGWAIGGVRLPAVAISYLDLLADALAPCALFAIGLSLRLETVRSDAATIALCTAVKLLVMPALVLILVRWVDLPPVFAVAAVVCAAVPTAKVSYVLADQYGVEKALVAEVISVTTSVSVLTLIGWLFLLGHLWPGVFGSH